MPSRCRPWTYRRSTPLGCTVALSGPPLSTSPRRCDGEQRDKLITPRATTAVANGRATRGGSTGIRPAMALTRSDPATVEPKGTGADPRRGSAVSSRVRGRSAADEEQV